MPDASSCDFKIATSAGSAKPSQSCLGYPTRRQQAQKGVARDKVRIHPCPLSVLSGSSSWHVLTVLSDGYTDIVKLPPDAT